MVSSSKLFLIHLFFYYKLHLGSRMCKIMVVKSRGVRGLVGAVLFQIYYRTDRDQFFYNWNRCTPPRVGFQTYSGAVFCDWFSRFGRFEILKKKLFFLIIKKLGFQAQYQYINLFKISSKCKLFSYLASHQKSSHT